MASELETQLVAAAPKAQASDRSISVFSNISAFGDANRMAAALAASTMVPKEYQNSVANCLVAMEVAGSTKSSTLMVMRNTYIVHGRPGWSSQYIIASLNTCGKFGTIKFKLSEEGTEETVEYTDYEWDGGKNKPIEKSIKVRNQTCRAYTTERETGEVIEGPEVSIKMAVQELWYTKLGSKWKTMPELMLQYRAAAFFGRLYAPEIMMGMQTVEELKDIKDIKDVVGESEVIGSVVGLEGALVGDGDMPEVIIDEPPAEEQGEAEAVADETPEAKAAKPKATKPKAAKPKAAPKAEPEGNTVAAAKPATESLRPYDEPTVAAYQDEHEAIADINIAKNVDNINDILALLSPDWTSEQRKAVLRAAQAKIRTIS